MSSSIDRYATSYSTSKTGLGCSSALSFHAKGQHQPATLFLPSICRAPVVYPSTSICGLVPCSFRARDKPPSIKPSLQSVPHYSIAALALTRSLPLYWRPHGKLRALPESTGTGFAKSATSAPCAPAGRARNLIGNVHQLCRIV